MPNKWAWELVPSKVVGGPAKIQATMGRFKGNLVRMNQPWKWPPTSILKKLQCRYLSNLKPTLAQIYKIDHQSSDLQRSARQATANMATKAMICPKLNSDPKRVVEQATASTVAIKSSHTKAQGKASHCGHPAGPEHLSPLDTLTCWSVGKTSIEGTTASENTTLYSQLTILQPCSLKYCPCGIPLTLTIGRENQQTQDCVT